MPANKRVRRALLFMPGDDLKKIRKGAGLSVDSIIMDLEDGVALNNKPAARQTIRQALADPDLDFGRSERLVRINPAEAGWQLEDIAATIEGRPDGYVLPKVESPDEVQHVAALVADHESRLDLPAGSIRLMALIETGLGVVNIKDIAQADDRLVALVFGAEDLAGSIGATRTPEGMEVFYGRSAVVLHAAAFGLQAIDSPFIDLHDHDRLRLESQASIHMGYTGKLAIHPAQVPIITEVFSPTEEQVDWATRLIAAHDAHQAEGAGTFAYEGQMVDMPMIRRAETILARAAQAQED